jgi:hypothetical protein
VLQGKTNLLFNILQTLELTDLLCTDFGNNGRNLLIPKFSSAMGKCEIRGLDC